MFNCVVFSSANEPSSGQSIGNNAIKCLRWIAIEQANCYNISFEHILNNCYHTKFFDLVKAFSYHLNTHGFSYYLLSSKVSYSQGETNELNNILEDLFKFLSFFWCIIANLSRVKWAFRRKRKQ